MYCNQAIWRNVSTEDRVHDEKTMTIAKVIVDYGTSKKRLEQREFWCRGGEYIDKWREIAQHENNDGFVFSVDGKARIPRTNFHKHWTAVLELADFDEERKQHIVPYLTSSLLRVTTCYGRIKFY